MQRSLFAAFRSADGRSLARALAVLVVISTVLGGAAAANAAAISNIDHCIDTPYGTLPAGHDGLTCCPGVMGGTPFIPPPAAAPLLQRRADESNIVAIPRAAWIPSPPIALADRPRGPPLTV
jgi:hypothetical protein